MATFEESAAAPPASAQEFYTWTFPGAPVRINLHLNVVESLGREVRRAFESVPSHSVEIGGILYGNADFAASPIIEIKDFEPFLCEYRADHKFILSDSDRRKLDRLLAARRGDGPEALAVLGYYRAHIGEGLNLRPEDLAVAQGHFFDPANIFLLVKPSADGSASAGFFFWDRGRIDGDFTYLEFPFDAKQLTGARVKPTPHNDPDPATALVPQSESTSRLAQPAWETPADSGRNSPEAAEREQFPRRGPSAWRVLLFALLIIIVAALGYESYLIWTARSASTPSSAQSDSSLLALQAERRGADLRISWNRNSPAITQATEGVLSIRDGDTQQQELHLDADQLRSGSVSYTPANATVRFRLEVTGPGNSKTNESVLALTAARPAIPDSSLAGGGPSPQPDAAAPTSTSPARDSAGLAHSMGAAQPPKLQSSGGPEIYLPPHPVRQVQPVLPGAVRNLIAAQIEVPVKVWISRSGTVTQAEPLPTSQLVSSSLTTAAQRAAMRWRFAPAMRGTETVPSEMILKFQYRPVEH